MNTNKKRQGLIETLMATLHHFSLDAMVAHGHDISHPLRQAVSFFPPHNSHLYFLFFMFPLAAQLIVLIPILITWCFLFFFLIKYKVGKVAYEVARERGHSPR